MTVALGSNIANPISTALSQWPGFNTMGKLANYGKLGATDTDAVIKALFANSEVGAWYDPSDLSTMFQDSTGTTPVTADGQPVGLILDKSQGLVLGPELSVNGDFSVETGWSLSAGFTISGGKLNINSSSGSAQNTSGAVAQAGKYYEVSFTIDSLSGGTIFAAIGGVSTQITIPGTHVLRRLAAANNYLIFGVSTGTPVAVIDNASFKLVSGNHAVAPSDAARPLKTSTGAADWTNYDAVDDVLNTTFQSSLGSSCTVCRANVGAAPTILTAQTIGTSYADSTDHAGLIIINRALTGQETTDVTAWLLAKGAT